MELLKTFWRYWKWLCIALVTSFVLLALAASIIQYFQAKPKDRAPAAACIESGGTWDEGMGACKSSA